MSCEKRVGTCRVGRVRQAVERLLHLLQDVCGGAVLGGAVVDLVQDGVENLRKTQETQAAFTLEENKHDVDGSGQTEAVQPAEDKLPGFHRGNRMFCFNGPFQTNSALNHLFDSIFPQNCFVKSLKWPQLHTTLPKIRLKVFKSQNQTYLCIQNILHVYI